MPMDMTKLTLWIAAIAVLSYAALVYYNCSQDETCHVARCGWYKPCGLSHAPANLTPR
jgi:hypothetical protein